MCVVICLRKSSQVPVYLSVSLIWCWEAIAKRTGFFRLSKWRNMSEILSTTAETPTDVWDDNSDFKTDRSRHRRWPPLWGWLTFPRAVAIRSRCSVGIPFEDSRWFNAHDNISEGESKPLLITRQAVRSGLGLHWVLSSSKLWHDPCKRCPKRANWQLRKDIPWELTPWSLSCCWRTVMLSMNVEACKPVQYFSTRISYKKSLLVFDVFRGGCPSTNEESSFICASIDNVSFKFIASLSWQGPGPGDLTQREAAVLERHSAASLGMKLGAPSPNTSTTTDVRWSS